MILFDRFAWRFADAHAWALRDVSLRVDRGEFVAITGPSGSGKTTLALAMCGLLIGRHVGECEGNVSVAGQDVGTTPLHKTAETIGLVQQNPETHFATLTVGDEIAFGMENHCLERGDIRRRSAEALELLSITHLRDRSLATLSGGEKQRVAVASIVAGKPQALILDEPTAGLDPQASHDLFRALADLCRRAGLAVVIIEHKLAHLLPLKPRLICLNEGRVESDLPSGTLDARRPSWLTGAERAWDRQGVADAIPTLGDPIVDMSHVTVELDGHTILHDVSLRIRAGEVVALLGPNGGGKSTLLHSLLGLVRPVHGSIHVCDIAVSPSTVSRLSRKVGLVFQNADHQLFADTVWREALFTACNLEPSQAVAEHEAEREAERLLEHAGLIERREDHPYRLSWGQKRRLNLISAILHKPQLLLLDEPFAGQDWENVTFLLDAIRGVLQASGRSPANEPGLPEPGACLMVTHDPRIVLRSCTRVLFISGGRVTMDAPLPQAFDKLVERGHEAYVPTESWHQSPIGSHHETTSREPSS